MPIIKSAAKRMRQNKQQYRENLAVKRDMREAVKIVSEKISNNKQAEAKEQLKAAQKAIDKAVKKGVIHKNTAARKKSLLTRRMEAAFGAEKTTAAKKPAQKKPTSTSAKKPSTAKQAASKSTAKSTGSTAKNKTTAKKPSTQSKK